MRENKIYKYLSLNTLRLVNSEVNFSIELDKSSALF